MSQPAFAELNVGDEIPELQLPPLTRHVLALYCGASGDHNPIHVDIDFARDVAGLDDVIGHGTLTMAYLGRLLTNWVKQDCIRQFSTRFVAVSRVGDCITCKGRITEKGVGREHLLRLELEACRADGVCLARGEAEVVLS